MNYELIDETDEYLVINKPAGLLVHGAAHIKELSLTDQLVKNYPELAGVGDSPERPGIVHRIDKPVSGLMVIAKTGDCFNNLKKQFQKRTIKKHYIALVYGRIEKDEGKINFPVERSSKGYKMAAKPPTVKGEKNISGRQAVTVFTVKKRFINYTLLKIKIKTGRTHQIRVHLAAYGHPLVGDDLYGTKKTRIKNKKLAINRIFLAATELAFTDRRKERKEYKINLPEDLKILLNKIK